MIIYNCKNSYNGYKIVRLMEAPPMRMYVSVKYFVVH